MWIFEKFTFFYFYISYLHTQYKRILFPENVLNTVHNIHWRFHLTFPQFLFIFAPQPVSRPPSFQHLAIIVSLYSCEWVMQGKARGRWLAHSACTVRRLHHCLCLWFILFSLAPFLIGFPSSFPFLSSPPFSSLAFFIPILVSLPVLFRRNYSMINHNSHQAN